MRNFPAITLAAALCLSALFPGCRHNRAVPVDAQGRQTYEGPTEAMAEVVAAINRNNEQVPTLWARHYYEADVVDDKGKRHFVNGDGALLYRGPRGLKIVAKKELFGDVFEIGSTDDRFWMSIGLEQVNTLWWGRYENVGKPCAQPIPVRPDLVAQVLGVGTIDTNFTEPPVPTMRYNPESDAYMFVWNARLPDRWVAQKEVWYDRALKLPRRVLLFDENGRVVLRAKLQNHQPVEVEGVPKAQWPVVATDYYLYFPDNGTTMEFHLSGMVPDRRGVPSRRGIDFPDKWKGKEIQIDENCGD